MLLAIWSFGIWRGFAEELHFDIVNVIICHCRVLVLLSRLAGLHIILTRRGSDPFQFHTRYRGIGVGRILGFLLNPGCRVRECLWSNPWLDTLYLLGERCILVVGDKSDIFVRVGHINYFECSWPLCVMQCLLKRFWLFAFGSLSFFLSSGWPWRRLLRFRG